MGRTWRRPPGAALLLVARFPAGLARRRSGLAPRGDGGAGDVRRGRGRGGLRRRVRSGSSGRTTSWSRPAGPTPSLVGELGRPSTAPRPSTPRGPIELRKLAGVLGETEGLGTADPRVDRRHRHQCRLGGRRLPARAGGLDDQPARGLGAAAPSTATSCSTHSWTTSRLGSSALRAGFFDVASWAERQVTTGTLVTLEPVDRRGARGPVRRRRRRCAPPGARRRGRSAAPAASALIHAGEVAPRAARRRRRCNAMARPVFGTQTRQPATRRGGVDGATASSRSTAIASLVEAARRTRPSSTPCIGSTSPRCMPSRSTSSPTITPPRTRPSASSCARSPRCPGSGSWRTPTDGPEASTFRVWLFRIARNVVANERRARRRRPARRWTSRSVRAWRSPTRPTSSARPWSATRPPPRCARWMALPGRSPAGDRPALRGRDEHARDRRGPRPVRGRGAGPDPSRALGRRPRPRPAPGSPLMPAHPDDGPVEVEA